MNRDLRERLVALANAEQTHVCVPLQGSGTFAIEATIATLLPRDGKLLVLVNGAYGKRMVQIARVMGRAVEALEWREDQPVDPEALDQRLAGDKGITHVAVVHCETTSGILNPMEDVAEVAAVHHTPLIIDAMSAFGALPLDARETPFAAVVASSNKCLQGVPGMGFALIRRDVLEHCKGNSHSLSLDLFDQWEGFEKNGQWRFTPPPRSSPPSYWRSTNTLPKAVWPAGVPVTPETTRCSSMAWKLWGSAVCWRERTRPRSL